MAWKTITAAPRTISPMVMSWSIRSGLIAIAYQRVARRAMPMASTAGHALFRAERALAHRSNVWRSAIMTTLIMNISL